MTRDVRVRAVFSAVVFALVVVVAMPASAYAGTNGWAWPVGSESFTGMSGWWDQRSNGWHLAQDMHAPVGTSVRAVAAGTVLESGLYTGYGPGWTPGGAMVILHKTSTGREFKALYGHLNGLTAEKGETVAVGEVIGVVNGSSPPHLHFGIHPGRAYPSDGNPFRGHTPSESTTYGWVDPVAFLRANQRVAVYAPPPLPVVATVMPGAVPVTSGVSVWRVWWATAAGAVRSVPLTSPAEEPRVDSALPTAFDARWSVVATGAAPVKLLVRDRRPRVTLGAQPTTVRWGAPATVAGVLANAQGGRFGGARVVLDRRVGVAWQPVRTVLTDASGKFSLVTSPPVRSAYRVRFTPPAGDYVPTISAVVTIAPAPLITLRTLPTVVGVGTRLVAGGALTPRHTAGTTPVAVQWERYESGRWVRRATLRAVCANAATGSTYQRAYTPRLTGRWRVRAVHPACVLHGPSSSTWRIVEVRS